MRNLSFGICFAVLALLLGCEKKEQAIMFPANDTCSVDEPVSGQSFDRNKPIDVKGWAADPQTGTVPEQMDVYLVQQMHAGAGMKLDMKRDLPRPDVADYFKKPNFVKAGFSGKIDVSSLAPGAYVFTVIQTDGNKKLFCSPSVMINIR